MINLPPEGPRGTPSLGRERTARSGLPATPPPAPSPCLPSPSSGGDPHRGPGTLRGGGLCAGSHERLAGCTSRVRERRPEIINTRSDIVCVCVRMELCIFKREGIWGVIIRNKVERPLTGQRPCANKW